VTIYKVARELTFAVGKIGFLDIFNSETDTSAYPLSGLINFCSCDLDSQEEHDTSTTRELLTKRSDFRSAEELVRCSPFGGVEFGKASGPGSTVR
jgi:hypothetical protein